MGILWTKPRKTEAPSPLRGGDRIRVSFTIKTQTERAFKYVKTIGFRKVITESLKNLTSIGNYDRFDMRTSGDIKVDSFVQHKSQFIVDGELVPTPRKDMLRLYRGDIRHKDDDPLPYDLPVYLTDVEDIVKDSLLNLYMSGTFDTLCKCKVQITWVKCELATGSPKTALTRTRTSIRTKHHTQHRT